MLSVGAREKAAELCQGDRLIDDTARLEQAIRARNTSLAEYKVLLVGNDMNIAGQVQRSSINSVGETKPSATCVYAVPEFLKGRLGMRNSTFSNPSELYEDLQPKHIKWCFQVLVSTELEAIEASVETHSPDAVVLVRPASRYLAAGNERGGGPKTQTVLSYLLSYLPYGAAGAVNLHAKNIEKTAALVEQISRKSFFSPVLVITEMELVQGSRGGARGRLRDTLRRSVPEVLFLDGGGEVKAEATLRAAYEVLYMRKFLTLTDAIRELWGHYLLLRDGGEDTDGVSGDTQLRMFKLKERILGYKADLAEFERLQYINGLQRLGIQAAALSVTALLCLLALRVLISLVYSLSDVFAAVAALGDDSVQVKSILTEKPDKIVEKSKKD